MSKLNPFWEKIPTEELYYDALLNIIKYQIKNSDSLEFDINRSFKNSYENLKQMDNFFKDEDYIIIYSFPKLNYINSIYLLEINAYESDLFLIQEGFNIGTLDISWMEKFLNSYKDNICKTLEPKGALINKSLIDYLMLDSFELYLSCLINLFSEAYKICDKINLKNIIFAFEKNKNNIVRL